MGDTLVIVKAVFIFLLLVSLYRMLSVGNYGKYYIREDLRIYYNILCFIPILNLTIPCLRYIVTTYKIKPMIRKRGVSWGSNVEEFTYYEGPLLGTLEVEWTLRRFSSSGDIHIGCKKGSREFWDDFFSDSCTTTYSTPRDSKRFEKIKKEYELFIKYLDKQNEDS